MLDLLSDWHASDGMMQAALTGDPARLADEMGLGASLMDQVQTQGAYEDDEDEAQEPDRDDDEQSIPPSTDP